MAFHATIERELSVHIAVSKLLAQWEPQRVGRRVLEALCRWIEWDYGELWGSDDGGTELHLSDSWLHPASGGHALTIEAGGPRADRRDAGLARYVWRAGRARWIADISVSSEHTRHRAASRMGLHTACAVPIRFHGEIVGVLVIFSRTKGDPESGLLRALTRLGYLVGLLMERHRTDRLLRVTVNRYETLSLRLLTLQDDERRRVARDLHDTVGQTLAALSIGLSRVDRPGLSPARMRAMLVDTQALVDQSVRELRTMSFLLHPPLIEQVGLAGAIRWLAEGFEQRTGIATELRMPAALGPLSPAAEAALFRVVQEALSNIHRHSGSKAARIRLVRARGGVSMEIRDWGRGVGAWPRAALDVELGVGIRGMIERMQQLGGTLHVKAMRIGTVVRLSVPYK